jgi:hypothetical protein
MLLHQILVLTKLTDARPFVSFLIPPSFSKVTGANCLFAELTSYCRKYQGLACCDNCSLQILQFSMGSSFTSTIWWSDSFLLTGRFSRGLGSILLSRNVLKAASFFFLSRPRWCRFYWFQRQIWGRWCWECWRCCCSRWIDRFIMSFIIINHSSH